MANRNNGENSFVMAGTAANPVGEFWIGRQARFHVGEEKPAMAMPMERPSERMAEVVSKVPKVTLAFWVIKIFATTLGETGGDALSMQYKLGYAVSTAIFAAIFVAGVAAQIKAKRYHPFVYWLVIVATTTVGTTTSDYLTRVAGLGYRNASILLFVLLMIVLATWRFTTGSISINRIASPREEVFYWAAILVSNTLGTALGDATADEELGGLGLGFEKGAIIFAVGIAIVAGLYLFTKISRSGLFWAAFILTRPLGATLGDLLTKPAAIGGLNLSRTSSSLVIAALMIPMIFFASREPAESHGH